MSCKTIDDKTLISIPKVPTFNDIRPSLSEDEIGLATKILRKKIRKEQKRIYLGKHKHIYGRVNRLER
jgi:hypothetical protein